MIVTARAGSYDFFDYYFTLGISVMFFFCGVFFPLDSLPALGAGGGLVPAADARGARSAGRCVAGSARAGAARRRGCGSLVAARGAFVLAERLVRRRLIL